ncbi:MAG: hypothetical protein KGM43_03270 [Planctomycetota bacterium]|nr:hypothetical protein [Planctomycetota bacterium]
MIISSVSCDVGPVRSPGEVFDAGPVFAGAREPLTISAIPAGDFAESSVSCRLTTDSPTYPIWTYELKYATFPVARFEPERLDFGVFESALDDTKPERWEPMVVALDCFAPSAGPRPNLAAVVLSEIPEELVATIDPAPRVETWPIAYATRPRKSST